jgi:hypothetical protein
MMGFPSMTALYYMLLIAREIHVDDAHSKSETRSQAFHIRRPEPLMYILTFHHYEDLCELPHLAHRSNSIKWKSSGSRLCPSPFHRQSLRKLFVSLWPVLLLTLARAMVYKFAPRYTSAVHHPSLLCPHYNQRKMFPLHPDSRE